MRPFELTNEGSLGGSRGMVLVIEICFVLVNYLVFITHFISASHIYISKKYTFQLKL